ncbi:uncharacterized protein [Polyergus mexicanus]|uniref:uncharacterized protein n=1 Tax=Polyergus mexicanus TaxID=615972 RepID=UPI0038B5B9E9
MSYCCICKLHSGSHADITFHTKVCSDHFESSFFEYKINKLDDNQTLIYNAHDNQNDSISTRKRKQSADEAATCNKIQTVKFIGDLRLEDFSSSECDEVVQKYLKKHNTRVNSLQKQVGRLTKKVKSFKDLLSQLHNKGLLSSNAVDGIN